MRKFWCLFLAGLVFLPAARAIPVLRLTRDSLFRKDPVEVRLEDNWLFANRDDTGFAAPGADDTGWQILKAGTRTDRDLASVASHQRIDWYRLHFTIDSSLYGTPLAVSFRGMGAYSIYLDGKLLKQYGHFSDRKPYRCYAPQKDPIVLGSLSPGAHVLAVRFANYVPVWGIKNPSNLNTGFEAFIGEADYLVSVAYSLVAVNLTVYVALETLFFTLFVIHLLLFLYYRKILSNLYFSIFCLSMAGVFYFLNISQYSHNPFMLEDFMTVAGPLIAFILPVSFSGINNGLFGRKMRRFAVIVVVSFCAYVINFFNDDLGGYILLSIGIVVLLEGILLPVRGMMRKVRGARIVGAGVLFFTIFLISISIYGAVKGSLNFTSANLGERIFLLLTACAILSIPASMSIYLSWNFATMRKDLEIQLAQVKTLSEQALQQEIAQKKLVEQQNEQLERQVLLRTAEVIDQKHKIEIQHEELKAEKQKSDELLRNILPEEVAIELKDKGFSEARQFDDVTVLFTDFVDFTHAGETLQPRELVAELNTCFMAFDTILSRHQIEKIKTIGDAYLAVCGLPAPQPDHALKAVAAATEIIAYMQERKRQLGARTFEVRIGVHSGTVVAGIVGVKKFAYDIWGDTVNTAARLEQHSEPGKINISEVVYQQVHTRFACTYRGEVAAKNKGPMGMYFVEGPIAV